MQALDGVSFQVEPGEIFGLLGPNGAGKTTLLSILACLLTADFGEVRLFERPAGPRDRSLRKRLGIVPQELALYGELTARENLMFFGGLYGLDGAALRERTETVLEAMGLADRADDRVDTYSGGMQRRLNLGAAPSIDRISYCSTNRPSASIPNRGTISSRRLSVSIATASRSSTPATTWKRFKPCAGESGSSTMAD